MPASDGKDIDRKDTGEDGGKRQPEALANFAATARSRDKVSPTGGRAVTPETAARPTDPDAKAEAATKVLREGTLKRDEGADEAVDRLPDRTQPPRN